MAGNADSRDAANKFGVAGECVPLAGLLDGKRIFFEVAGAVAFGGIGGMGDFPGLDDVYGIGKSGDGSVVM